MLELIGREFSKETSQVKKILDSMGTEYRFIDIDFNEDYLKWIKANKIISLPVVKKGKLFIVGNNMDALRSLIE